MARNLCQWEHLIKLRGADLRWPYITLATWSNIAVNRQNSTQNRTKFGASCHESPNSRQGCSEHTIHYTNSPSTSCRSRAHVLPAHNLHSMVTPARYCTMQALHWEYCTTSIRPKTGTLLTRHNSPSASSCSFGGRNSMRLHKTIQ